MGVTVVLPTVLRRLADGQKEIPVAGGTLREALGELARRHPDLGRQILQDDGTVRPFVRVFVDQKDAAELGPEAPLPEGAVVRVVPAIAGGR